MLSGLLRSVARSRGLAFAVVATLGAGVGSITTTFGVVDAALLRPPPFPDPSRLAIAYLTRTKGGSTVSRERWSLPRVRLLRRLSTTLANVANYSRGELILTGTNDPEPIVVEIVSPEYFTTLGVTAAHGRTFVADEDGGPRAHPVGLIGDELWRRRYAADPRVVGSTLGVNGVPLNVVGVLSPGFRGLTGEAQLWIPTAMAPALSYADYLTTNQNFISVVTRLRAGVDLTAAQAELLVLGREIGLAVPFPDPDSAETLGATAIRLNDARIDAGVRRSVLILFAAVALLHLLAISNVTSLLLGRVAAHSRELAVRIALGCSQGQLFRYLFTEAAVLAVLGSVLGLGLAWLASRFVSVPTSLLGPRNFYGSLAPFAEPAFGTRVLLFGLGLTGLTALVVAGVPAAAALRWGVLGGLREGGRGLARGAVTLRRFTPRGAIVAFEAALAVILLAGGGLMINSFVRMQRTNLGIDPNGVLTFALRPSEVRVPPSDAPAFITRVLDAIHLVPGVVAATVDGCAPLSTVCANAELQIVGRPVPPSDQTPSVLRHYVGPEHFRVLGISVLSGRGFTADDDGRHPGVAIVNQAAARRFWPHGSPIGQRVWFPGGSAFDSPDSAATIVGVVGDVAYQPLDQRPFQPDFFTPYAQFTYASRMVMVRTSGDPGSVVVGVRTAVRSVDSDLPLFDVQTLRERLGGSWSKHRFDALLLGGFAAVALLLAASGIYAVVAHAVSQRTREMGIRLALGATPAVVLRLVMREGMMLPLLGMAAGVAGSLALTGVLRASLYEVAPTDPGVFAVTTGLMLLVAALACLLPARRATRADPLEALRSE